MSIRSRGCSSCANNQRRVKTKSFDLACEWQAAQPDSGKPTFANRAVDDERVNSSQRQPPFVVPLILRMVATRESHCFPGGVAVLTTIVPTGNRAPVLRLLA